MSIDELIARNAEPIWLFEYDLWEMISDFE